jgi:hypothetical protein
MYDPMLFRDRERPAQVIVAGLIPAVFGAVAGVLVGVSSGAYWGWAVFVSILSVIAGFEHLDGWGAADRGLAAGFVYGVALLLAHLIAGTTATVSLGSFPPLLAVVTAIAGMFLSALGGWMARVLRERRDARGDAAGLRADSTSD